MVPGLDLRTLGVAITFVNVALCTALMIFWRTQKTYAGFGYWVACQGVALATYLLLTLRGVVSDLLSIVLVNGLMVVGASLRSRAALQFFARSRSPVPDIVACAVVPLAVAWFLYAADLPVVRLFVSAAGVAFVMGRAVTALAPSLRTQGASVAVTVAFFVALPVVLLARGAAWVVSIPSRGIFASTATNQAFFLFLLVHDVAITIFFLMLNTRRLAAELIATQGALERLAVTDPLTGLPNRRKLDERLAHEWRRQRRARKPLSLLVIDIDHFKPFNDRHGHLAGDACLVRVATAMQHVLREEIDLLVRLGGEEFVALLPESGPQEAVAVAERVRAAVESLGMPHGASEVAPVVTVSVGWASTLPVTDERGAGALFGHADAALYRAKQLGRNRVVPAERFAVPSL